MKKMFTMVGLVSMTAFFNAQIVINEIYTGGGLLNALIAADFVELKNIGTTSATLTGATLQYGPATGPFTQYNTIPNITLAPGQTYLIQQATGLLGGINLVNPNLIVNAVLNFDGSGPLVGVGINLSLGSGKVALASNATQVTGPTASNVIDFVGYGSVDQYEGSGSAPSPTILTSISRVSGDSNDNDTDFTSGLPSPQSGGVLAVGYTGTDGKAALVKNTVVKNNNLVFAATSEDVKIYSLTGQIVKKADVRDGSVLDLSSLAKGNYVVTGTVNGYQISQKIIKH